MTRAEGHAENLPVLRHGGQEHVLTMLAMYGSFERSTRVSVGWSACSSEPEL